MRAIDVSMPTRDKFQQEVTVDAPEHTTMYLRQAGLTSNPTFSYLYSVRCQGRDAASEAPLERKYSRCAQAAGQISEQI
ncbi:MAG: hypothetical protein ACKO96_33030 [Flammeovirgaceae bacterium]